MLKSTFVGNVSLKLVSILFGVGMPPYPGNVRGIFFGVVLISKNAPPHRLESNLFCALAKFAKKLPMNGNAEVTNVYRM